MLNDLNDIKEIKDLKNIEGMENISDEELGEVYNKLLEINNLTTFISSLIALSLLLYILNGLILYRWSSRYINRYSLKISLLDSMVPIWNNRIYFSLLKNHSKSRYRRLMVIFILLICISIVIPYFLIALHLFLLYVKGRIFKIYLIDKKLIYLHYFSLGLLTPFILWKER